jgi:hypothetical protein
LYIRGENKGSDGLFSYFGLVGNFGRALYPGAPQSFHDFDHLFTKIKDEAALWCLEGAKGASNVMPLDFFMVSFKLVWPNSVCKTSNSE